MLTIGQSDYVPKKVLHTELRKLCVGALPPRSPLPLLCEAGWSSRTWELTGLYERR